MRQPTRNPTTIISATTNTLRTRSASVRPASTAERAIGSERNRSIRPLFMSVASPIAVGDRAEHHGLHEDAGHQVVDVVDARRQAAAIAPPKT